MITKIVLIGAGNVATHLGKALQKLNFEIVQVYSRTNASAKKLGTQLKCDYVTDIKNISRQADLYILAVNDDAIAEVLQQISFSPNLIVHTSGAQNISVFEKKIENYGVLYPLQTFSKTKKVDFTKVPFFTEANSAKNLKLITIIASALSPKVYSITSEKRKALHIAAVFACNFSNHMYTIAENILSDEGIPLEVLFPLIDETVDKIKKTSPISAQTGPAVRGDSNVMEAHIKFLREKSDYQKIYTLVSKSILHTKPNYGGSRKK